ncbi:MAG: dihydroorotate dehydrogenase-like protein [Ignavibacteria bacterium]|nr:dihydroorotate dehydrogenase-like protein [Ignavibacteria bacterium]
MDLKTKYLGLTLKSPLVASASPLTEDLKGIQKLEDAGASAVVLPSIFEEQIRAEQLNLFYHTTQGTYAYAESLTYFPEMKEYRFASEQYLELIRKAKEKVNIPIIASLNGATLGGWIEFAKKIEQAGADALEMNIYFIPTDLDLSGNDIENTYIEIVKSVKSNVNIPIAVKLSPFFSNFANMAKRIVEAGANALVLFNRFYQPDVDLENLEVKPSITLSTSHANRLPMRWIAILKHKLNCDFAATSGIHTSDDVVKMLLVGANVTMLCSALLKNGVFYLLQLERELIEWMVEHEYSSVQEMIGVMSREKASNPNVYERAQYVRAITSYKF